MRMLRTLSLEDSISVAMRKLLQGGRRGSQAIYKFVTKEAGSLNSKDYCEVRKTRYQVKEWCILGMGRCNPLGSLHELLS